MAAYPYWAGRAGHGWNDIMPGQGYATKTQPCFPKFLKLHFTRVSSVQKYSTRGSSFNLAFPKSKGQAIFTFYNIAIHHWNALPNEIKNTNDFNMFKQLVKKHLASHGF